MFLLNGKPLSTDTAFEHNGVLYPSNWLRLTTIEEKNAIGIEEVPDPENYDGHYYSAPGVFRQLEEVKRQSTDIIRGITNSYMKNTDWYVIRKMERNVDVPQTVTSFREAVVAEHNRLVSGISSANNVAAIATLVSSQNWPEIL